VSPCVFTPMTFGNVQTESIATIYAEMSRRFPSDESCFINRNYPLLQRYASGREFLDRESTLRMMDEVRSGEFSRFNKLYYGAKAKEPIPVRQPAATKVAEGV